MWSESLRYPIIEKQFRGDQHAKVVEKEQDESGMEQTPATSEPTNVATVARKLFSTSPVHSRTDSAPVRHTLGFVSAALLLMPRKGRIQQPLEAPYFGAIPRVQAHTAQHPFAR